MIDDILNLKTIFEEEVKRVNTHEDWENIYLKYLGKKGELNDLFLLMSRLPKSDIAMYGQEINKLKNLIEATLQKKQDQIVDELDNTYEDPTIKVKSKIGKSHLVSRTIEQILDIFLPLGFIEMNYKDVDFEFFAFTALNFEDNHPARDDVETFFIEEKESAKYGKMVLTPHTSNGQNHEMTRLKGNPPIRMINIGKCYRPNWDATHTPVFHQFEGMVIDKDISISHLKGTIEYFVKNFFGNGTIIRLRPYDFRFTEPSFEIDISCANCKGKGLIDNIKCKICKYGWLELGGAGMIHPNVLKMGGVDPEKYSGWAFGFGVERIAMMKGNLMLPDLRMLYSNDISILKQL